ncbi:MULTISPECIES: cob(I)yrinic acid a,c-diamide adenosyltransferase [Alteromonadaceae]|uniref:Corrinoid adenosyltransferase n=1 Tax=Brumicola blandensis TaxID=3075611 RepID=A0AAW8QWA4_9ALTE|nr:MULTISPECIES: cob(I)yrinic acid a,c-diamide adenosyltransferase [unclassified Alteromonas]MDT0581307.1 cob(I)yrinic acid a,c-diamide adenosyltransferase [Alteromonas sp. W409]MDT0626935.1 cob(I)yrinic acid a,c-diamide adenosyltransferase [Alteromonas sp. W364]
MKIYTKTGDKGTTQVYTSEVLRLSKDDIILECYGTLDELNSHIGLLSALLNEKENLSASSLSCEFLQSIQHNLFSIGFAISDKPQLNENSVEVLETAIDELQSTLSPQTKFILPGGSQLGAQAHVARTIARRAERNLVALSAQQNIPDICIAYINRLSDYLFVAARSFNARTGIADIEI